MPITQHAAELVAELKAEREPLAAKVVEADREERELLQRLSALQAGNQASRSRLAVIDEALRALTPLIPPQFGPPLEAVDSDGEDADGSAVTTTTITAGSERAAVIDVLRAEGKPLHQREIWRRLEVGNRPRTANFKAFQVMCGRMLRAGQLSRPEHGIYGLPEHLAKVNPGDTLTFVELARTAPVPGSDGHPRTVWQEGVG